MFYEGNKTQGWIRVATERYKLFQMFIWTVLLIISTSIKPANETPQVYGALTLFFIEPTGDIPFSDSSLPESVLYIQKKKKKKQVSFAKHSFLAKYTVVPGEKCHTPLFPGADKSRRNTECSMAAGYIAFSSRAFSALVSCGTHFSFLLLFCSLTQPRFDVIF